MSDRPKEETKWISWVEFCYNTSFDLAIKMSPFQALYGSQPPTPLTYLRGTTNSPEVTLLVSRDELLKELKQNLSVAQSQMKLQVDKHRKGMELAVGD